MAGKTKAQIAADKAEKLRLENETENQSKEQPPAKTPPPTPAPPIKGAPVVKHLRVIKPNGSEHFMPLANKTRLENQNALRPAHEKFVILVEAKPIQE